MRILAFDIGGTLIKSAIVDESNNLLDFKEHTCPVQGGEDIN